MSPSLRAGLVFLASLLLYYSHFGPISQVDVLPAPYGAWSLVTRGDLELSSYPDLTEPAAGVLVRGRDGGLYSKYPPGRSLFAVPVVLPFAWTRSDVLGSSAMRRLGKLVAALCSAAAVAGFYLACLRVAPRGALFASVVLAAGTAVWPVASQALWAHGPALLCTTGALLLLLAAAEDGGWSGPGAALRSIVFGTCLGLAIITRPTTVIFTIAALALLLWDASWRCRILASSALAVPAAGWLAYDQAIFGEMVAGGYGQEAQRFTTATATGLFGLLFAPSKGLFVYSPALLLAPLALRRTGMLPPAVRRVLLGWLAAAVATLLLYARWHAWGGGWCYGPRFLIEALPAVGLFLALAYEAHRETRWRGLFLALAALSISIQALGVFADDDGAWHRRHPEGAYFGWRDSQIEAAARQVLGLVPAPGERAAE